ncbi:MAG TPA: DUF885 domain-containing protein [Terriglobales bacterium]|nr:DUF885 domain-containing protein [Terriglobales bacterium]
MIRIVLCFMVLSAMFSKSSLAQSTPETSGSSAAEFNKLVDDYFNEYFKFHPSEGTAAGFHQYDNQLEDPSQESMKAEIASIKQLQARFDAVPAQDLPPEVAADLELVKSDMNARLLRLQEIRQWEKNPDLYSSGLSESVYVIMSRNYAPQPERLQSVIAREKQMGRVFAAARKNLKDPPRVYTGIALEQLPGIIGFFQKDVPEAFNEVKDPKLLAEFKASNGAVIEELKRYENFVKADLLPISKGDFRIGAENYRKKLLYEEMVDIPLDRLLQIGYDDLHRNQQAFKEVAGKIDPKRTPQQILEELEKDHPAPNQLLQTFRGTLGGLKSYIETHHIVTIPSPEPPIVQETPPFARALTFASMDTPGPYEKKAKEAYFNVTLPEANWPKQKVQSWMEGFNRGTITSTAIHEVYPGHYVQFLWLYEAPSKVRKLIGSGSNAEGWAHYCEQMMLDEGYGNNDPKLRMGQLQDALLRDVRFIAGIEMHTGKMTVQQATDMFVKEGYQTQAVAEREALRGTSDPTYLVYTLGKLEILKLRADYKQKMGDKFNLEQFHDDFLKQGFPPVKIIRKLMLGNDSPVL